MAHGPGPMTWPVSPEVMSLDERHAERPRSTRPAFQIKQAEEKPSKLKS